MNSFDLVFSELQKNSKGMTVDLKRKTKAGDLIDAKPNELASLGTKSTVASTAGLLAKLTPKEKLAWAIETKNEANEFYAEQEFKDAMIKYVECLAATDFGKTPPEGAAEAEGGEGAEAGTSNVDAMVVPVLCNLAACCIQLGEWSKAASFGEQATLLRPHCSKAQLRMGLGLLRMGEFDLALVRFKCALLSAEKARAIRAAEAEAAERKGTAGTAEGVETAETVDATREGGSLESRVDDAGAGEGVDAAAGVGVDSSFLLLTELSTADWQRLPLLVRQAKRGQKQQRGYVTKQKQALQRAFAKSSTRVDTDAATSLHDDSSDEDEGTVTARAIAHIKGGAGVSEMMSVREVINSLLRLVLNCLLSFLRGLLYLLKKNSDYFR
jgi:tetratricopeptide (TPR) repeat protein